MRFRSILSQLPYLSFVLSLAFITAALPVESVELTVLTPDNFKETIANGVWFIEHFSPYCRHCRNFAPTWSKLVESIQQLADPGIHLAQVNCAVHGDLCRENGIDGYPQMNLYRDGQYLETYGEARDYDLLTAYLSAHAKPTSSIPLVSSTLVAQQSGDTEYRSVAITSSGGTQYNPTGTVATLDEKTFSSAVAEGHMFVKFFAPWCGHCKKLAPIWVDLARRMQDKLIIAEVNCEEYAPLCRSQGVTGYPMLFYYPRGRGNKLEYTGARKLEQLRAFSEKLLGPAVQVLRSDTDLELIVSKQPVIYLFLHHSSEAESMPLVIEGSGVLFGTPPIYSSSSTFLYNRYSIDPSTSVILAFKDHELGIPAAIFHLSPSNNHISYLVSWLLQNRLPTSLELDSDTFQDVMNAAHKPLVVIAASSKADMNTTIHKVREIAARWRNSQPDQNVIFTWMDGDKWASWLKSMYGVKGGSLPHVVVANHEQLIYYDTDQSGEKIGLTSTSMLGAIDGIYAGTISFKYSENTVERLARYMSARLTDLENYVYNNPWHIALVIIALIIVFIAMLKYILLDDKQMNTHQFNGVQGSKASRLD